MSLAGSEPADSMTVDLALESVLHMPFSAGAALEFSMPMRSMQSGPCALPTLDRLGSIEAIEPRLVETFVSAQSDEN